MDMEHVKFTGLYLDSTLEKLDSEENLNTVETQSNRQNLQVCEIHFLS